MTAPSTSSTAVSNSNKRATVPSIRSWLQTLLATKSRPQELRQTVITLTSYMTISILALCTVTTLFCFFLAVSVFDDLVRKTAPSQLWQKTKDRGLRMVDWVSILDEVRVHLTHLAEFEQEKRESWPFNQIDSDRFHDLVTAVTDYLHDYVHTNRKQQQQQQQ
ncbi:hypothetical protein BDB00DRAFT_833644 [Zychaea mexicana]|uniref:uncharacterized protein n=1 Tax=Zychaea mexicana TaxID=64656 RepID=UPI0022FE69C3|nr:uncharacterized protein BDB00DRAFT_833644 [Zychaea mexicana]KAI9491249.1 hypothetical protein BDB00DRAFT_833644 [Zychaea mexicana]